MPKEKWATDAENRSIAFIADSLYIITFLTSIPAVFLLNPILTDPDFITSSGDSTMVIFGAVLDILNAIACAGTAVVLFSVIKRQSEAAAVGYLSARLLEAAIIVMGVICLLAIVTLQKEGVSVESAPFIAHTLVDMRDWTFLLGPGTIPAFNALFLGYALYEAKRLIPTLGLIGAPLLLISAFSTIFGLNSQVSLFSAIATLPIFLWELSLGIWLITKGFHAHSPVFEKEYSRNQ